MSPTVQDRPLVVSLDGSADYGKDVLGGKAFSVNRMRGLGLPVPPAFALPTYVCGDYHDNGRALSDEVWAQVVNAVHELETATGRTFGAGPSPLLVSVRSGAAQSMPGMMDTVLNLGLTKRLVSVLAEESNDERWAMDTWRRFCRSYASIVLGVQEPTRSHRPPKDAWQQLREAIGAVFDSWTNERVQAYRTHHKLGAGGGTAVTVQAMVFGNRDSNSGTGVLFSRDPATGEAALFGEWLSNAQGEDVVSGEKTPQALTAVKDVSAEAYAELERVASVLENELRDLADVEFTIESGRMYMLQSRAGKRSPQAAVRIAAEMAAEGKISKQEALARINDDHVAAVSRSGSIDEGQSVLAKGVGVCPGVSTGVAVSTTEQLEAALDAGQPVVLVRPFTSPDDVPAMFDSVAVVTEVGGATSHAALVCREIGLPCIVGAGAGAVDTLVGKLVSVDGTRGVVCEGVADGNAPGETNEHLATLAAYARELGLTDHPVLKVH